MNIHPKIAKRLESVTRERNNKRLVAQLNRRPTTKEPTQLSPKQVKLLEQRLKIVEMVLLEIIEEKKKRKK